VNCRCVSGAATAPAADDVLQWTENVKHRVNVPVSLVMTQWSVPVSLQWSALMDVHDSYTPTV